MTLRQLVNDNPLMAGLAALAAGAVVGALIPETRREQELLGPHRDKAVERARELARQQMANARQSAASAIQQAVGNVVEQPKATS